MPNSAADEDEPFAFTPIAVPDPARRNARGRLRLRVAGAAGLAVVVGLVAWWVVAANEDHTPAKHAATLPHTFGAYTRSAQVDQPTSNGNTDFAQGPVDATYTAPGGKEAWITLYRDPGFSFAPSSDSDDAKTLVSGTHVSTGPITRHPSGRPDGDIKCAVIAVSGTRGFTQCAWQDKTMAVVYVPVLKGHTVVSAAAPADLRAFLAGLKVTKAKSS